MIVVWLIQAVHPADPMAGGTSYVASFPGLLISQVSYVKDCDWTCRVVVQW
jgi:hypothetical protein